MTPDRWQTIKEIFNAAVLRPPDERAGFLADACGNDEAVRSEVASLLAAHAGDESFLAVPAFAMGAELLIDLSGGPSAGDQIGPYKILSELGSGGMGDVFLAQDTRLGRNIALKLLPVEVARDLQRVRRFEQEARTASALNHPNVCVIHEIGKTSDGRQFIAMEYIEGVTLRTRLEQKRMTLTETLDVGAQVAWALEAAHAAGVVHRDIKPENIMLRRDGYVKVLDFGIAKLNEKLSQPLASNEASTLGKVDTEPGTRMGTVKYMSPEQLRERPVDERTDIWSLGVVLHEMATGATPFAARTTNETIAAILERQPLDFTPYAEDLPAGLRRIIGKALSKNRRDRYQKVASLAADLRQVRRQIEVEMPGESSGPESGGTEKVIDILRQPIADFAAPAPPQKKTLLSSTAESILTEIKEHKKATIFAGVGAVLALLVVGYVAGLFSPSQEPPSSPHMMSIISLTNAGNSVCAAISPDGESFAHAEKAAGMQELQVTSLVTFGKSFVVPPADVEYLGVTFSRDGHYLYFTRTEKSNIDVLYELALPGGTPRKIMEGVNGPITFPANGGRFAFVRSNGVSGESSLVIANVDGSEERTIAERKNGKTFSRYGPAWSPDEKSIACAESSWENGYHTDLVEVGVDDGHENVIGKQRWFSIRQVAWLEDKSGLIISAKEQPLAPFQLWRISYPQGEAVNVTNELAEYDTVSLSGNKIVTMRTEENWKIWSAPDGDAQLAKPISSGVGRSYGLNWTSNGKILFSAMAGKNQNIFRIDSDGSNKTQLTVNAGDNYMPAASPDGRYVVFASYRDGHFNIWRMSAEDGSEPLQLTFGDGNFYPSCSPDGRWVVYDNRTNASRTIWKVPIDGGDQEQLTDKPSRMPIVSPDNQFIACRYYESGRSIAILPFAGGPPVQLLKIPIMDWQRVQWTTDGRALTYIDIANGVSNIWSYDLSSGSKKQLTDFKSDQIFAYGWSPDFKQLACERGSRSSDVTLISNAW